MCNRSKSPKKWLKAFMSPPWLPFPNRPPVWPANLGLSLCNLPLIPLTGIWNMGPLRGHGRERRRKQQTNYLPFLCYLRAGNPRGKLQNEAKGGWQATTAVANWVCKPKCLPEASHGIIATVSTEENPVNCLWFSSQKWIPSCTWPMPTCQGHKTKIKDQFHSTGWPQHP